MKKRYTFYLDAPVVDEFRVIAGRKGIPMSEVLNRLMRAYMTHEKRQPSPPPVPESLSIDG